MKMTVDSGARNHVVDDLRLFQTVKDIENVTLESGDGTSTSAAHI